MQTELSKNILATVVYYDILNYPLTSFEIWKYLMSHNLPTGQAGMEHGTHNNSSLLEVVKELENAELKKNIEEYRGFYFLRGRREIIEKRIEKNKISDRKFRIIKRAIWFLRFVPYVRAIAVTGKMAMKNADKKSDLDFLVILKEDRIFTGRILVTFLIHFLGVRRYKNKITNRACLNYYLTEENLKSGLDELFSSSEYSFALHLFASSEYSFIYPVFGWKVFQRFQRENQWIRNYRINYLSDEIAGLKLVEGSDWSKIIRKTGEVILNFSFIENILKKWQMKRIMADPRTHKTGSFVTANDRELIFLPEPQGIEIYHKFRRRLDELI